MKTLLAFLLMTTPALSQTVNNATVNMQGANQSVIINQFGNHSANLNLSGNDITAIITQSGNFHAFSLSVNCGLNCPNSPYIVNQY